MSPVPVLGPAVGAARSALAGGRAPLAWRRQLDTALAPWRSPARGALWIDSLLCGDFHLRPGPLLGDGLPELMAERARPRAPERREPRRRSTAGPGTSRARQHTTRKLPWSDGGSAGERAAWPSSGAQARQPERESAPDTGRCSHREPLRLARQVDRETLSRNAGSGPVPVPTIPRDTRRPSWPPLGSRREPVFQRTGREWTEAMARRVERSLGGRAAAAETDHTARQAVASELGDPPAGRPRSFERRLDGPPAPEGLLLPSRRGSDGAAHRHGPADRDGDFQRPRERTVSPIRGRASNREAVAGVATPDTGRSRPEAVPTAHGGPAIPASTSGRQIPANRSAAPASAPPVPQPQPSSGAEVLGENLAGGTPHPAAPASESTLRQAAEEPGLALSGNSGRPVPGTPRDLSRLAADVKSILDAEARRHGIDV